jgi:hypothetical protein
LSQKDANLFGEIVERIPMLGKNYQLAATSGCIKQFRFILQQLRQFLPLFIRTAASQL